MATRKAYAKSNDGLQGYMFPTAQLRDFFVENTEGNQKATSADYRHIRAKETSAARNQVVTGFNTYDMSIPEFWDGMWDLYDRACELGIA